MPAIREYGLGFLVHSEWDPVQHRYGGLVMIYGTLMTSLIALIIAVPVSFGIALFLVHDHGLALRAHHDLVLGLLEVDHLDHATVAACGKESGLVDQVGQVGAREAGRAAREDVGTDVLAERHLAHVLTLEQK